MREEPVLLIVDDIASNVEVLATILKDEYQIKVAQSGEKAIELSLKAPYPDLILLDIEMPSMDGFEVLKELKTNSITKDIPVIFVTSHDATAQEEKGLLEGAVDYITKPIRPIIVKARIKTHLVIKDQRDKLIYAASHDQLTGLYNRHHLTEEGGRKFSRALRYQDRLSVIMIDIDHFKKINDTYGHLVGDTILKEVSKLFNAHKRNEDFASRFGGEEFVILLDNCRLEDAYAKADRLRKSVEALLPENVLVTASMGVAELNYSHSSFEDLLKDADGALYKAKEEGRNRVIAFEE